MGAETRLTSDEGLEHDPLLEQFWDKGLVLLGDRVREEYALHTPIFIDLRHKLYDDLDVLSSLGRALHPKADLHCRCRGEGRAAAGDRHPRYRHATWRSPRRSPRFATTRPVAYGQMRKKPAAYPGGRSGVSSYMGTKEDSRQITLIDDVMASGRN